MENGKNRISKGFTGYVNYKASDVVTATGKALSPKDSGRYGKAFEVAVARSFGLDEVGTIACSGCPDLIIGKAEVEVKSGCGILQYDVAANGEFSIAELKNLHRYVIYIPSYDETNIAEARLMKWSYFIQCLDLCGLIRLREDSRGFMNVAIQSFANSKKKTGMWLECIYDDRYTRPLNTL